MEQGSSPRSFCFADVDGDEKFIDSKSSKEIGSLELNLDDGNQQFHIMGTVKNRTANHKLSFRAEEGFPFSYSYLFYFSLDGRQSSDSYTDLQKFYFALYDSKKREAECAH